MSEIILNEVTFYYSSPYKSIFENLTLNISTDWKTGLIGRNGRGKTTLLNLIHGDTEPVKGRIIKPVKTEIFPFRNVDENKNTFEVIKNSIAPFDEWEKIMNKCLEKNDKESLDIYSETHEKYMFYNGYEIDSVIDREINEMNLDRSILERPFQTLSGGEKTRSLIISLFLKKDIFPLIDEPTNHIDIESREKLGNYLKKKNGFILISHDRYFLDLCTDHILSINKNDVRISSCNYSVWEYNMKLEQQAEDKQNEKLKSEITQLKEASKRSRKWSESKENEKAAHSDKGAIGAQAARLMKQAINFEKRIDKNIEEKKKLFRNTEKDYDLKIYPTGNIPNNILEIRNLSVEFDGRKIFDNFNLTVSRGERVALTGKNGSGKTSVFNAILGKINNYSGFIHIPSFVNISLARQIPEWQKGTLKDLIEKNYIDEIKFRQILGNFNVRGDIWDKPLEYFSEGEKKKIELCRTIIDPVMFLMWDEPLNYLDISTRGKIEESVLKYQPTMLFIEHDRYFTEKIATKIIYM